MFVCPRCRERLVRKRTEHGVFFVCPGCQGRAVSLAVLRRMAGRKTTREIWRRAIHDDAHPGVDCPICRRVTVEVPVPLDGRQVHLDACIGCHFVWFDPKELEQLPEPPPAASEEKPVPQEVREEIAVAEAESVAAQAEAEDDPFWGPAEKWKWIPGMLGMPVECDVAAVKTIPWVTWGLAAALVGVFAWTHGNMEDAVGRFGLVPSEAWKDGGLTILTSFFLHAGLLHLIANTYFLLIFGDNVEDYLGRWRYVLLLVAAAVAGNLAHVLYDPHETIPCIGASGGISGVIVFYALRFPEARLGIMLRYFVIFRWFYMPAWVALILWAVLQVVALFLQLWDMSNVSALAHIGGAAVGVLAWMAWRQK
jgi:membrane associated rhomboid family serine protease